MRITVFTPTYNRGYIIEKLYESLQRQIFTDFEWIVVDDGSTDDTEKIFQRISKEHNSFPIRYIKTENGGKHRAINMGVSLAEGELFFIVDSDDHLTDSSLAVIDQMERSIPEEQRSEFAGVAGQKGYDSVRAIGKTFPGDILDITSLERVKYKVTGDKSEVFYTSVMKKYPFPTFEGEKFVTECVVWDRIAADGLKLRFFNEIVMICNYLPDGLTAQGGDLFVQNPNGWALYLYQNGKLGKISKFEMWNTYLQFYYAMRKKKTFRNIAQNFHINPIYLWIRLTGMRVFYRLYS